VTQDKNLLDQEEAAPALDVDSLLAIHRHDDGNIAICRKVGGDKWENLWMITPLELRGTFRAFQDWLLENAYFSTQAYWRTAPKGWIHKPTGLPAIGQDRYRPEGRRRFGRVTENLRYLNCLSCDIDCGRSDQTAKTDLEKVPWRDAQRRTEDLQDTGIIPAVSMMGYSGRGLYVIWLLHGDLDPDHSAPAYDHDVVTWKIVQKELMRRLKEAPLPIDPTGSLITQVYRIGGTRHFITGERAQYFIYFQADQYRRLISYTLRDMAKFLNLPAPGGELPEKVRELAKPPQLRKIGNRGSAPARSIGTLKRNALRADDLLTIQAWRGSFLKRGMKYPDGHISRGRLYVLEMYADFLKGSRADRTEALSALRDMAAKMTPPYPSDLSDTDLESIIKKTYSDSARIWSNKSLCDCLGITEDMARELKLKTIRPRIVALEADQARPLQADYINWRRGKARQFLELYGSATTGPSLAKFYKGRGIIGANRETANQDLNAIDYKMSGMARSRGGRPRKRP